MEKIREINNVEPQAISGEYLSDYSEKIKKNNIQIPESFVFIKKQRINLMFLFAGWKTINYVLSVEQAKEHIKTYERTVYELLQEFLKYYSTFDFNTYVSIIQISYNVFMLPL